MISPVVLAPMAGITDKPFRQMMRLFGNQTLFTEMVGVESLHRNHPVTRKMMDIREEHNLIVQLVGIKPEAMIYAAQMAEDNGAIGVDINMGCPVKKLITNGSGAALMKTPDVAARLVESVVSSVSIPVSVKMRIGWDEDHMNAVSFAQTLERAGASRLTVHGRTKAQGYAGSAHWDVIGEVKSSVSIPVYANGDITDRETADKALQQTKADGVMIGRGALGKPWILQEIESGIRPEIDRLSLVLRHLDLLLDYYGSHGIFVARKHIAWYMRGKKGVAEFCQNVYAEKDVKTVKQMITTFLKGDE